MKEILPYLTGEERKQPIHHRCHHFDFKSRADLSGGVIIEPFFVPANGKIDDKFLVSDVAAFTLWWSRVFLDRLNGFSGIDCVDFKIVYPKSGKDHE